MQRPKFFVDENLNHEYAGALRKPFKSAIFSSHVDEKLRAVEDVEIFEALRERNFTVVLTADRRQLYYADERAALRAAGLHWVGVRGIEGSGVTYHAEAIASLLEIIPQLITNPPTVPHAFYVSPDSRQRIVTQAELI